MWKFNEIAVPWSRVLYGCRMKRSSTTPGGGTVRSEPMSDEGVRLALVQDLNTRSPRRPGGRASSVAPCLRGGQPEGCHLHALVIPTSCMNQCVPYLEHIRRKGNNLMTILTY